MAQTKQELQEQYNVLKIKYQNLLNDKQYHEQCLTLNRGLLLRTSNDMDKILDKILNTKA